MPPYGQIPMPAGCPVFSLRAVDRAPGFLYNEQKMVRTAETEGIFVKKEKYDVLIVGSGPAGIAASLMSENHCGSRSIDIRRVQEAVGIRKDRADP